MNHDLTRLVMRSGLELESHPSMAFVSALKGARHHGIRESKEGGRITTLRFQSLKVQPVFAIQHGLAARL